MLAAAHNLRPASCILTYRHHNQPPPISATTHLYRQHSRSHPLSDVKAKTTMGEDPGREERNLLARQDASVSSRRSPLGRYNRTDDLWLELDDDECSEDSTSIMTPNSLRTPAISLPQIPPKSAPPCPQYNAVNNHSNGDATTSSQGGTPLILRHESLLKPEELRPDYSKTDDTNYCNYNGKTGLGASERSLQQSLSTPNPQETMTQRKDSEYRRFKSEGSAAGSLPAGPEMDMDGELSPIADRSSPPHRFNLIQQDSVVNGGPISKQSNTEQVLMMHTLKTKLSKYQSFIDKALSHIRSDVDDHIVEGCTIIAKVMSKAWMIPKVSHDLSTALCDYLRDQTYLDILIKLFINTTTSEPVRLAAGRVLEDCMLLSNREYLVNKGWLKKLVGMAMKLNKNGEQQRMSLSIMEKMLKHSNSTSLSLIEYGVLDHILLTCKREKDTPITLRHAALALCNLCLYSCSEGKKKIISKKVPEWLFLLATQADELTRYYACLAISVVASAKEIGLALNCSDTLALVEPFLNAHPPLSFSEYHYKHSQGEPKEWLERLLPIFKSAKREAHSAAAYHFTMEAVIKKNQNKLEVFQEIGAIQALKEVASSPDEVAAKFASEALTVIGEEVPYKLAQQVPSWTTNDVQYWVKKIGFEDYVDRFARQMVDGDLLLHLSERELEVDLEMQSGLHRKRFIRELESLKIAADYSGVDESNLDQLLMSLSPELSVYTYKMLSSGINRSMLAFLTDELMQTACGIMNPIHRLKLLQAFRDAKHPDDVEVAMLSKQIDVFISYRRSTGNQLASLIKVLLQLRGYKVFIDVDKLYAGKFDSSLLKNIQAAKHFILVLTPHSLDRLLNDHNCEDWIHKELRCAFQFNKNIIPIFDQSFEFPQDEDQIPKDVRHITKYNGVKWVHDYQDACMHKVVRFLEGELNRSQSMNQGSTSPSHGPSAQQVLNASNRRAHTNSARSVAPAIRSNPQSCRSFRLTEPTTPTRFKSSHSTANRSSGATSPVPSTVARESSRRKLIQSSVSTACDKS
ncbi:unnamed protein product [Auanema sp. JU1783]|nr:unnamed protein product [Auanema sp. JU1783]